VQAAGLREDQEEGRDLIDRIDLTDNEVSRVKEVSEVPREDLVPAAPGGEGGLFCSFRPTGGFGIMVFACVDSIGATLPPQNNLEERRVSTI
jgi:hypothetical protein